MPDDIQLTVRNETQPAFILVEATEVDPFVLKANLDSDIILLENPSLVGKVALVGPKGESAVRGLSGFVSGRPIQDEVISGGIAPYAVTLNVANCYAKALVATTSGSTFVIKKNNSQIGTIVFAPSSTNGIISFTSTSVSIGDYLTIHAPLLPDVTLADISIILTD
jgi:hypothetical protein